MEPWHHTATQILENIRSGNLTVEQYASSLLERIKQRDDDVKAWAYLDPKSVLEQARALDQVPKYQRGPLHGLPICRPNMVQLSKILRHPMHIGAAMGRMG
ncbi:hypothetical protein HZ326_11010 [Fusarium oxysporum f. sp. albedinis]|nr:hypothetical protein HZ326_11010 [Fusarium oxysporum f. sp. albedinis]